MLGIECLAIVSIATWSACTSFVFLKVIDLTMGLRLTSEEEELGSDYVEHGIRSTRQLVNVEELHDFQRRRNSFNESRSFSGDGLNGQWTLKMSPQVESSHIHSSQVPSTTNSPLGDAKASSSYSSQICLISYTQSGSY